MAIDHLHWKVCNQYLAFANRQYFHSVILQIREMEAKMVLDAAKSESRPTWSDDGHVWIIEHQWRTRDISTTRLGVLT